MWMLLISLHDDNDIYPCYAVCDEWRSGSNIYWNLFWLIRCKLIILEHTFCKFRNITYWVSIKSIASFHLKGKNIYLRANLFMLKINTAFTQKCNHIHSINEFICINSLFIKFLIQYLIETGADNGVGVIHSCSKQQNLGVYIICILRPLPIVFTRLKNTPKL